MPRWSFIRSAVLAASVTALAAQEPTLDPRALGMAGATTSNAQGIHAVGFNPARLAFSEKDFSINLGGLGIGVLNNFLSIAQYNKVNGADFTDPISPDYVDKQELIGPGELRHSAATLLFMAT